jgi:hypothetical protein
MQTPQASMTTDFVTAVGGMATFHSVPGRQFATTTTVGSNVTLTTSTQTLLVGSISPFTAGAGQAVIVTGDAEPLPVSYTSLQASPAALLGCRTYAGSKAVTTAMTIYNSAADGHTRLHEQINPVDIVDIVNSFTW